MTLHVPSPADRRAAEIRAKFYPRTRPVAKASIDWEPAVAAAIREAENRGFERARLAAAEQIAQAEARGYERGLATARVAENVAMALGASKSMAQIADECAKAHGFLGWRALRAHRKNKALVQARQEAMWRLSKETDASLGDIGRFLGGFDHTTVMHAIKKVDERLAVSGLNLGKTAPRL